MAGILDTVAILINKRPAKIGGQTSNGQFDEALSMVLDASVSETHTSSATITSHPVESGTDITDHVHKQPDSITINGIISNTSLVFPQNIIGVAVINSISRADLNVSNDLAKTAYDQLRLLVEGKQLVRIATTLREYTDMLLEDLTVTRNATYGDSLNFTVKARQVRLVKTSVSVKIPKPADPKKTSKKSLGKDTPVTPPEAQTPTSIGQKLKAYLGRLL